MKILLFIFATVLVYSISTGEVEIEESTVHEVRIIKYKAIETGLDDYYQALEESKL